MSETLSNPDLGTAVNSVNSAPIVPVVVRSLPAVAALAAPLPSSDQTKAVLSQLLNDGIASITTIKAVLSEYEGKKLSTADILGVVDVVKKDVQDATAALPVLKAGYKTSELWVLVGTGLWIALGHPSTDHATILGSLAGLYATIRAYMKKS